MDFCRLLSKIALDYYILHTEVNYVISVANEIVPVEVKAGTKGAMQSLFLFLKEKNLKKGIRISNENFSVYDAVEVYPLYAVNNIGNK
ncbi:MAG: hypothetical protein Q8M94_06595 [Ignavibacteria bacterium]|nr:hypothetical protein [Ignavibacteria bacterium]